MTQDQIIEAVDGYISGVSLADALDRVETLIEELHMIADALRDDIKAGQ